MKHKIILLMVVVLLVLLSIFAGLVLIAENKREKVQTIQTDRIAVEQQGEDTSSDDENNSYVSEREIISTTEEILNILNEIYYFTQDTSTDNDTTVSGLMMSLLTESMQDKNRLDKLLPRASKLAEHPNQAIAATGMGLFVGISELSKHQEVFIDYIRNEDVEDPSLSEFQFQMAQMQTENKDSFFTIIEGTSLYPYVFIEFSENEGESNRARLSEQGRKLLLNSITSKFSESFAEEDIWHEETGNRNAILLIVKNYKEFLESMEGMATASI